MLRERLFPRGLLQEGTQAFEESGHQVCVTFLKAPMLTTNVKILNVMCTQIKHICGPDAFQRIDDCQLKPLAQVDGGHVRNADTPSPLSSGCGGQGDVWLSGLL